MLIEFSLRAGFSFFIAETFYFSASNWFDLIITVAGCTGLYGFVFNKRIVLKEFWKVFLILNIVYVFWEFNNLFVNDAFLLSELDLIDVLFASIDLIILIPFCIAIFKYGFRSNDLWVITEN